MEMERILRNPEWIIMSGLKWDSVVDKIVAQANIEEKHSKAMQNKLKEMSVIYVEDNHTIVFTLLPLLLRDARSKADSEKVIYFTKVFITITQLDYTVAMVHNFVQVYCREIFFWV